MAARRWPKCRTKGCQNPKAYRGLLCKTCRANGWRVADSIQRMARALGAK